MTISAAELIRQLHELADPPRAAGMALFFRTGPGEYGEGDFFLGIRNPVLRSFVKKCPAVAIDEIKTLLSDRFHEIRLAGGLLLCKKYEQTKSDEEEKRCAIYHFYLDNAECFNNWDLVDLTAPGIAGAHLLTHERSILDQFAKSPVLWKQRIAVVATLTLIRNGEFEDTFRLVRNLMKHPHDLIHKACGWMLREIGKRDREQLTAFLMQYRDQMPRTMLRYAIERYPEPERLAFLKR